MKTAVAILGLVAAAAIAQNVPGSGPAAAPPIAIPLLRPAASTTASAPTSLPFTLGYDTTRITKPLLPDGRPDYLAAINEMASKGVTRDNNMAIAFLEVLDDQQFRGKPPLRDEILAKLDISRPPEHLHFKNLAGIGDCDEAAARPWRSKEDPALADLLNDMPLAAARGATERSRWYIPLVRSKEEVFLIRTRIPMLGQFRLVSKALVIHANLAVGEGRQEDAPADLLAAHRLGCLLGQDPLLIGKLVAASLVSSADKAIADSAAAGAFSPARARKLAEDLISAGPMPDMASAIDNCERFIILDFIVQATGVDKGDLFEFLTTTLASGQTAKLKGNFFRQAFLKNWPKADYDTILRRVNQHYDDLVKAMGQPSFGQRAKAIEDIGQQLSQLEDRVATQPASTSPTQWTGDFILSILLTRISHSQISTDLAMVQRDLAVVALGLCAYKADNGKYPDSLDVLAPKYLTKVPEDFCSGKPFIYKKTADGYILYSVGENMTDDGGKTKGQGGDDIVVKTPSPAATQP
jgi:hypothetical protein